MQGMTVTGESSASLYSSVTEDTADVEDDVPAMLEPGQLVNGEASKYCVGRPIGIGQHSICYMVQDVHTRLEYCLKVRTKQLAVTDPCDDSSVFDWDGIKGQKASRFSLCAARQKFFPQRNLKARARAFALEV